MQKKNSFFNSNITLINSRVIMLLYLLLNFKKLTRFIKATSHFPTFHKSMKLKLSRLSAMITKLSKKLSDRMVNYYSILYHLLFEIILLTIIGTIMPVIITDYVFEKLIGYGESSSLVPIEPLPSESNQSLP